MKGDVTFVFFLQTECAVQLDLSKGSFIDRNEQYI